MPAPHGNSQRLQNKVLPTNGNLPKCTRTRDLQMAFKICTHTILLQNYTGNRQQATVILNRENVNGRNFGQGKAQPRQYERLKLGGGHACTLSLV